MRRQITWLVALTTTAVVFSFMIPLGLLVRTLAQDRAMAMADQEARSVATVVSGLHDQPTLVPLLAAADQRLAATTSVLMPDGRVLGTPMAGMARDPEVARALAGEAFSVVDGNGGRVLVPVVVEDGMIVVRSMVTAGQLFDGVGLAWAMVAGLSMVLTALALVVAGRLGRSVSEPLQAVADTAHRLRAGELAARAPVAGTEETVELARALNGLADRITGLLADERAAVGDLAHRLRTPVTALRLEAESVEPTDRAERLGSLILDVQAGIDSLVREARRDIRDDLAISADLAAEARVRVAFWTALAEDQGRRLTVTIPDRPVVTPLAANEVHDIVDILIDNVFAHTDEGVGFAVALSVEEHQAVLSVSDQGPGFPVDEGSDGPRVGFTGLGLDIVQRTVRAAGGEVHRSAPGEPGARITLVLPLGGR